MRPILLACVFSAAAPTAIAEEVRTFRVAPGETVILSQPHRITKGCQLDNVRIETLDLPDQGSVEIRRAEYEIGDFGGGRLVRGNAETMPCRGRRSIGVQVLFNAKDSATGSDTVRMKVHFTTVSVPATFRIFYSD